MEVSSAACRAQGRVESMLNRMAGMEVEVNEWARDGRNNEKEQQKEASARVGFRS